MKNTSNKEKKTCNQFRKKNIRTMIKIIKLYEKTE